MRRLDSQSKFQMFTIFSGRNVGVPSVYRGGTPAWRLHTGLCKFVQNISTNIWGLGKRTDLKIREVLSLVISYNSTISWRYPLNGFRIIFFYGVRIAWQCKPRIVLLGSTYVSFFQLKCTIIRYMVSFL